MISSALADLLRSGRPEFNARFLAARRLYPELDPAAFRSFVETDLDPLARAVESVQPGRLNAVIQAAYDAALELVGQRLAGPGARRPGVGDAWRRILPAAATLVAAAPSRVIPAICNAAHHLDATPDARGADWARSMAELAPHCSDPEAWLLAGQLAAWRAGLAHLRRGALEAAAALPDTLARAVLRPAAATPWETLRQQLLADPWLDPSQPAPPAGPVRARRHAGAFKGFGGLFLQPPDVTRAGDAFLVRSGDECWSLTADIFGATFHRATAAEFEAASVRAEQPVKVRLEGTQVLVNGQAIPCPDVGPLRSAAADRTTVAVTGALSHSILLLGL